VATRIAGDRRRSPSNSTAVSIVILSRLECASAAHGKDHRGEGALIGAGVGALTGNVLGRNQDRLDEQRAANGAFVVDQANRQAAAQAITNLDLIRLSQAGVSDDIIISAIRSRGARLDLSPSGLIALKQKAE
jgi:hypothetical protein